MTEKPTTKKQLNQTDAQNDKASGHDFSADGAVENLIVMLRQSGVDEFAIASGLLIGAFTVAQQSLDAADWARCLDLGAKIIRAPEHRTEQ